MFRWLKKWQYNRLLCRIIDDLNRLKLEDLKQIADYADSLYFAEKYRQERAANGK